MRSLHILIVFFLAVACDVCYQTDCANGGECYQGVCRCEDGIERTVCKRDTCFFPNPCEHGHCEYGFCICDEYWTGQNCDSLTYIDHDGKYYGGYVCDNYQTLGLLEIDHTQDLSIFDFYEPNHRLTYEALFTTTRAFVIEWQPAFTFEDGNSIYVDGAGKMTSEGIEMNIRYFYEEDGEEFMCTYFGEKKM